MRGPQGIQPYAVIKFVADPFGFAGRVFLFNFENTSKKGHKRGRINLNFNKVFKESYDINYGLNYHFG